MPYAIISKNHGGELLGKSKEGLGTDFETYPRFKERSLVKDIPGSGFK